MVVVVVMFFRYDERVPRPDWGMIQKSDQKIVLVDDIDADFARANSTEMTFIGHRH
jgi:hypothetical protein